MSNLHFQEIAAQYPKLFDGKRRVTSSDLPRGWQDLLYEFCDLLLALLTEAELKKLKTFHFNKMEDKLELRLEVADEYASWKEDILKARMYSIENRSSVTCQTCGRLYSEDNASCTDAVCKQ